MRLTGRGNRAPLIEAYFKEQGLWYTAGSAEPEYSDTLELDLGKVEPSLAGPARPQDRVSLAQTRDSFQKALPTYYPKLQGADFEKQKSASVEVKDPSGKTYMLEQAPS